MKPTENDFGGLFGMLGTITSGVLGRYVPQQIGDDTFESGGFTIRVSTIASAPDHGKPETCVFWDGPLGRRITSLVTCIYGEGEDPDKGHKATVRRFKKNPMPTGKYYGAEYAIDALKSYLQEA